MSIRESSSFSYVALISDGVFYKKQKDGTNHLKLKIHDLNAFDDSILTDYNLYENGTMVDELLKAKIEFPETLKYEDLLIGDREAILVYLRQRMQREYSFRLTEGGQLHTIDLSTLDNTQVVQMPDENGLLTFKFPCGTMEAKYKLLTVGDLASIRTQEMMLVAAGYAKQNLSTNLKLVKDSIKKLIITDEYAGAETITDINAIVNKIGMGSIANLYAFKEAYDQSMPRVKFEVMVEEKGGKRFRQPIPFNAGFFIPNARI